MVVYLSALFYILHSTSLTTKTVKEKDTLPVTGYVTFDFWVETGTVTIPNLPPKKNRSTKKRNAH